MLLLPVYLGLFLGSSAAEILQPEPFARAFLCFIAVPFALAFAVIVTQTLVDLASEVVYVRWVPRLAPHVV